MIPNQQNKKERKPEIGSKTKKVHVIIPLIVVLMLICVIAICIVGAHSVRPTETAELNKDVEQEEEHISAAVDIAATSIGTNAKATFTVSTGEIHIYNSSTSGADATISKSSWNTFLKKIITADGNLDAVKSITFDNRVYAPADSSNLFSPIISNVNYPLTQLVTINKLSYLVLDNVTNINSMFDGCSSLESIDGFTLPLISGRMRTADYMFRNCSSLIDLGNYQSWGFLTSMDGMFYGCSKLVSVDMSSWRLSGNGETDETGGDRLFMDCTSLREVRFHESGILSVNWMSFSGCSSLTDLVIKNCKFTFNSNTNFSGLEKLRNLKFVSSKGNYYSSQPLLDSLQSVAVLDMRGLDFSR